MCQHEHCTSLKNNSTLGGIINIWVLISMHGFTVFTDKNHYSFEHHHMCECEWVSENGLTIWFLFLVVNLVAYIFCAIFTSRVLFQSSVYIFFWLFFFSLLSSSFLHIHTFTYFLCFFFSLFTLLLYAVIAN